MLGGPDRRRRFAGAANPERPRHPRSSTLLAEDAARAGEEPRPVLGLHDAFIGNLRVISEFIRRAALSRVLETGAPARRARWICRGENGIRFVAGRDEDNQASARREGGRISSQRAVRGFVDRHWSGPARPVSELAISRTSSRCPFTNAQVGPEIRPGASAASSVGRRVGPSTSSKGQEAPIAGDLPRWRKPSFAGGCGRAKDWSVLLLRESTTVADSRAQGRGDSSSAVPLIRVAATRRTEEAREPRSRATSAVGARREGRRVGPAGHGRGSIGGPRADRAIRRHRPTSNPDVAVVADPRLKTGFLFGALYSPTLRPSDWRTSGRPSTLPRLRSWAGRFPASRVAEFLIAHATIVSQARSGSWKGG